MDLRPETEPRLEMVVKSRRRQFLAFFALLFLLLATAALILLFVEGNAAPRVDVLPEGYWKRPTRLQRALAEVRRHFSIAPQVFIHAEAFKTKKLRHFGAVENILGRPPFVKTNSVAAWILDENDWANFEKGIVALEKGDRIFSPKITVLEAMEGSMFAGNTVPFQGKTVDVGLFMNVLPERVVKNSTRLAFSFLFTEFTTNQVHTNASFVIRATVPSRDRVLVLQRADDGQPPMCLLLSVVNLPKK